MANNGRLPREYQPGTPFNSWVIIREVERTPGGHNRRFLCRCSACGAEKVKYLSNLLQGKGCLCTIDFVATSAPGRAQLAIARATAAQATDEGRMCLTCSTWKPWDAFYGDPRTPRGKASNCIDCASDAAIRRAFGLTLAEWTWLHDIQGGVCALCGEPETSGRQRLSVDHDHSCCGKGKGCKRCIRGLLCGVCNRVLGQVEARPVLVCRFADYLARRPFASLVAGAAESVLEDVVPLRDEPAA